MWSKVSCLQGTNNNNNNLLIKKQCLEIYVTNNTMAETMHADLEPPTYSDLQSNALKFTSSNCKQAIILLIKLQSYSSLKFTLNYQHVKKLLNLKDLNLPPDSLYSGEK